MLSGCITVNKTYVIKPQDKPCCFGSFDNMPVTLPNQYKYFNPLNQDWDSIYRRQFFKGEINAIDYFELLKGNHDLQIMKSFVIDTL